MAFKLVRSEAFESDVFDAFDYLTSAQASGRAAERLMARVDAAADALRELPFLYALSRKPELRCLDCRELFVGAFVIIYRIEGETVYLLRFLHQSRDASKLVIDWEE